ncbi:hypothetical protein CPB85DRAFT_1254818 [Mucidula mucida]|nr:hypothetical protein CPB85DRAFT_1254818 [Mucidula mucida]
MPIPVRRMLRFRGAMRFSLTGQALWALLGEDSCFLAYNGEDYGPSRKTSAYNVDVAKDPDRCSFIRYFRTSDVMPGQKGPVSYGELNRVEILLKTISLNGFLFTNPAKSNDSRRVGPRSASGESGKVHAIPTVGDVIWQRQTAGEDFCDVTEGASLLSYPYPYLEL